MTAATGEEAPPPAPGEVRTTALIVASALLMQTLDGAVVVIALPRLARDLGIAAGEMSLVVTVYLVALIAFLPISAWASSRFGAKRMFVLAMALFALFSTLSALAPSFAVLVAARFCQGASGSMLSPVGRTLLMRGLKSDQLLGATFWLTVPAVIGPVVGPPLGGLITDLLGWRYVFWLNVPIAIVGMALVLWKVRPVHEDLPRPADIPGIVLCAASLTVLVVGLETLARSRWAPGLLALGAVLLVLTVRHLRRAENPAFALALLRHPGPRSAAGAGMVLRIGAGAMPFILPLLLQLKLGFSATLTGALYLFAAMGSVVVRTVMGLMLRAISFRNLLICSSLALGFLLALSAAIDATWPLAGIAAVIMAMGTCRALVFTTLGALAFLDVPPEDMGSAAVIYSVTQQVPAVLGVALASLMLSLFAAAHPLEALGIGNFAATFIVMGLIPLISAGMFARYPADFGASLGRRAGD